MFRVQIWYISACYLNVLLSRCILCSKVFVSKKLSKAPLKKKCYGNFLSIVLIVCWWLRYFYFMSENCCLYFTWTWHCRLFGRIIAVLSSEERGLFRERIRSLDKKIHPGLTKLTWASKGISDYFIGECRNNCSKVHVLLIYNTNLCQKQAANGAIKHGFNRYLSKDWQEIRAIFNWVTRSPGFYCLCFTHPSNWLDDLLC